MDSKKTLHITVNDKIATFKKRDGYIVCGNSCYRIKFTFDSEWDGYGKKTARFIWNGQHVDVTFEGDTCDVPLLERTNLLQVGVYVGDMSTTTSAEIECRYSVKCIESVAGSDSHSIAELNIAFGSTEPEDKSKLWVKSSKPSAIVVTPELQGLQFKDELGVKLESVTYPTRNFAPAIVGDMLYMIGGYMNEQYLDTIYRMDLNTGESILLDAKLPSARSNPSTAVIGNKIYIIGGETSSQFTTSEVCCFDTETGVMESVGNNSNSLSHALTTAIGSKIYILGGRNKYYTSSATSLKTVSCFDTDNNSAVSLSVTLPTAAMITQLKIQSSDIYAVGSKIYFKHSDMNGFYMYCFDTEALTITQLFKDSSSGFAENHVLFGVGKKVYLFSTDRTATMRKTRYYDPETETFEQVELSLERLKNMFAVSVEGKAYMFYGSSESDGSINPTIYQFYNATYGEGFKADQIHLHTTTEGELFTLVNTPQMNMSVALQAVYKGNADGIAETVPALLYKNSAWTQI